MHKYTFDVKLFAAITVDAESEEHARKLLRKCVNGADVNFGAWPNGDPILCEVFTDDGEDPLIEIDGEPV